MSIAIDPGSLERVADGLDHPECVAADRDGRLHAGGEAGQLYRIDAVGKLVQYAHLGGFVAGIALDGDGFVYACVVGDPPMLMRVTLDGDAVPYGKFGPHDLIEPNFPVFATDGTLFVSDSGRFGENSGRIWTVRPGGDVHVFDERACGYTNGLAIDADGRWLYVVESSASRIVRIRLLPGNRAGALEVVVALPRVVPDGLAFDADGALYIACYRPDRVYRLASSGELEVFVDDWTGVTVRAPTNVAFFGPGLSRLALSALGGSVIRAAPVSIPGMPLRYPTRL